MNRCSTANQGEGEASDSVSRQPGGEGTRSRVRAEEMGQHGGQEVQGLLCTHGQIPGEPGAESGDQL